MRGSLRRVLGRIQGILQRGFAGPPALAFLPAAALGAYWLGGETFLIIAALGLPLVALVTGLGQSQQRPPGEGYALQDTVSAQTATAWAEDMMGRSRVTNLSTACILIEVDGLSDLDMPGAEPTVEALRDLTLTRLRSMLRREDRAARMGDTRFAIFMAPAMRLDLESLLQLASRLQAVIEEPAVVDSGTRYLSASIGFCGSPRLEERASGTQLLEAAQIALAEAMANGPSAIRAWSENLRAAHLAQQSLQKEVRKALGNGQIQAWFQPQLCTSTGAISGVEALARWIHPERGIVPPAQFLRSLEEGGMLDRLGETMLNQSLTALRHWDEAGLGIPRVSINLSAPELRDPRLSQRISWDLDRFGFEAERLGIEILETVIASAPEGVIANNIRALGEMGCYLDLDDFGTGHASITTLRRFSVNRLKIDRSFVTQVDRDEEQRRMVAAILSMSDRLGLETLAEGVESVGEHALLAQLGCDHVQGFGIARPMPADQLVEWARAHAERVAEAQRLGRNTG